MTTVARNPNLDNLGVRSIQHKISVQILLTLRKRTIQNIPTHPRDLIEMLNKTKDRISKETSILSNKELIQKEYNYDIGLKPNYLTFKITEDGMTIAEQLLHTGLTDEEWSKITEPSPLTREKSVEINIPKSENPHPPTPPFRKIKKDLLLIKAIEMIKKDVKKNLLDNYESVTRDGIITSIIDDTLDIFQNNLYTIFEKLDIVKFT